MRVEPRSSRTTSANPIGAFFLIGIGILLFQGKEFVSEDGTDQMVGGLRDYSEIPCDIEPGKVSVVLGGPEGML